MKKGMSERMDSNLCSDEQTFLTLISIAGYGGAEKNKKGSKDVAFRGYEQRTDTF
jgi:hypothetical protein